MAANRSLSGLLTVDQILTWAEGHHTRTGRWPVLRSGSVAEAPGETWVALNSALRRGNRGLPGGETLARLLARERGARNRAALPPLTPARILTWADAHRRRTGRWPSARSGPVIEAPGEHWGSINSCLRAGLRGLPGGSSLSRLMARKKAQGSRCA